MWALFIYWLIISTFSKNQSLEKKKKNVAKVKNQKQIFHFSHRMELIILHAKLPQSRDRNIFRKKKKK
jgi:hypothetical protein